MSTTSNELQEIRRTSNLSNGNKLLIEYPLENLSYKRPTMYIVASADSSFAEFDPAEILAEYERFCEDHQIQKTWKKETYDTGMNVDIGFWKMLGEANGYLIPLQTSSSFVGDFSVVCNEDIVFFHHYVQTGDRKFHEAVRHMEPGPERMVYTALVICGHVNQGEIS